MFEADSKINSYMISKMLNSFYTLTLILIRLHASHGKPGWRLSMAMVKIVKT